MIHTSEAAAIARRLESGVREWVLQGFQPDYGHKRFESAPRWQALQRTGCELWLDTGDIQGITGLWSAEFRALTTNNTLLNTEVQRGQYDDLVRRTAQKLRALAPDIPDDLLVLEIAFVLNAYHGLRLVERFDAFVSVEEHTDLAYDVDLAVLCGKRFHAICPERFIVKLPLTPEGLRACKTLEQQLGMTSDEFMEQFEAGTLGDDAIFFTWYAAKRGLDIWNHKLLILSGVTV